MKLSGKKIVVVGGAGFIGSHIVDKLLKEDVKEVLIYDNFLRGSRENLTEALKDARVKIYDVGGDIIRPTFCSLHLKALTACSIWRLFGSSSAMNILAAPLT